MMTPEKLRCTMDDEVDAETPRRLIDWRRERAVAQRYDTSRARQFSNPFKVRQRKQRVRRGFDDDELRSACDCVGEGRRNRMIDEGDSYPETGKDGAQELRRSHVVRLLRDNVITLSD